MINKMITIHLLLTCIGLFLLILMGPSHCALQCNKTGKKIANDIFCVLVSYRFSQIVLIIFLNVDVDVDLMLMLTEVMSIKDSRILYLIATKCYIYPNTP